MATPSTSGDPAAGDESAPTPSLEPTQRRHPTSRISHIVRTYLDLSTSRKRRAAPKSQPKAGGQGTHAAEDGTEGSRAGPPSSHPSRLLRELGIRVSRYTHEERRDIILRYMQKRSDRQVVNRAASKVPSRQALAERRLRGAGGKFLGKDAKTADNAEGKVEEEPELPPEVISNAGGVPIVGMVFESEEKAYEYYVSYAGNVGFSVRKGWWDKTAKNSNRSRVYICSREGPRSRNDAKRPRPETRVGCPARIAIKLTPSGKYRVTEFVEDHNHQLAAPFDIEMLKSQRVLAKVQPGSQTSNIPPGYKNYLRSKSTKDMKPGDLRALMDYFQRMKSDNPSFYYGIQVDENDKATNVFWADARSIMDYHYFCDVVCLDMIYKENDCSRPLALFLGMNHHRQMVIFGAAFLYDETVESFKWLLETFKSAMCGKHPKTILTDRSTPLKEALGLTWPGTVHRFCVWQIYQNTVKSVAHMFSSSEEFTHDFRHCVFDIEDEQEFVDTWNMIMEKYSLRENELLIKLYEDRENWALPYNRQIFSGDIKSTLQAENVGNRLKEYLGCDKDLSSFLKFFESSAEKRRQEEMQADYQANQGVPRIPLPLLWQAANLYTPITFDLFRKECELSMDCMAYGCGEFGSFSEYMITVKNKTKDQLVRIDSLNGTVACTCKKFENAGLLCCHILKVYELRNVKEIPPQYFLKRWRKDAKLVTMDETDGFNFDSDTKSSVPGRYAALCRLFYKIAAKAAENVETFALMASQSDQLLAEVEGTLRSTLADKSSGHSFTEQLSQMAQNDYLLNSSHEVLGSTGKKCEVARRRNDLETNKRKKARKGQSDETEGGPSGELNITPGSIQTEPRNTSNQFVPDQLMQGHFVLGHNFGLCISQNIQDNLNQFGQASSVSTLQQQPFSGNGQLTQDAAAASTKPAKRYPLALWTAILGLIMLVGVYIFSLSLKQNGMLFGLMQTNMIEKEREKPCHDPRIPDTEIPYVHYPTPNTYDREECSCTGVRFFAILSMQRSGSGWVETLLNSHPNVSSNGEIFSVKERRSNITAITKTLDKLYNLDWYSSAAKNECTAAVGLKWMLNQGLMKHHQEIVEYFNRRGVSAIFLLRRNLLQRYVSILANAHDSAMKQLNGTHKAHVHSKEEAEIRAQYKPNVEKKG